MMQPEYDMDVTETILFKHANQKLTIAGVSRFSAWSSEASPDALRRKNGKKKG